MTLSNAIDISSSSLATTSQLTSIASRNISNASNVDATRKLARVITDDAGGARVSSITRAAVSSLHDNLLGVTSDNARLSAIVSSLDKLDLTGGADSESASPTVRIGSLQAALQTYSSNTSDQASAASVVYAAADVASTIQMWAKSATDVRAQADSDIRGAVTQLNTMLKQVEELDRNIINGTVSGADITDQLDQRDAIVAKMSEQIGITIVPRANNSVALYTDSGITLFDGTARAVTVQNIPLTDGAPGGIVTIDGVPAIGTGAIMPVASGRIAGLVEVRDHIATTFAAQIDDIAGSLIRSFAEKDQGTPATLPDAPGLFSSTMLATVPAAGSSVPGLAKSLIVNPNVDPAKGGDLMRLRDGAISNPGNSAYVYNQTGANTYNGRVQQLVAALKQPSIHDPATAMPGSANVLDFAASSSGWLQAQRQTATQNSSYTSTLLQRSQDAFSKDARVNIDDEMMQLLGLERTYQASAKLISTVDAMYSALMQAIR